MVSPMRERCIQHRLTIATLPAQRSNRWCEAPPIASAVREVGTVHGLPRRLWLLAMTRGGMGSWQSFSAASSRSSPRPPSRGPASPYIAPSKKSGAPDQVRRVDALLSTRHCERSEAIHDLTFPPIGSVVVEVRYGRWIATLPVASSQ